MSRWSLEELTKLSRINKLRSNTKRQKKVVKKFVNYILNDVRPGGGRQNSKSESEDAEDNTVAYDNMQERTEVLENNLKLKDKLILGI